MRTFCLMLLAAGLIAAPARTTAAEDPICTDRPTKSTGTCTAEEGHPQVEAELVNFSESTTDGVRTRTWVGLNPTVKVGIGPTLDAELNLPTWIDTRVHDASGATTSAHGVGDLTARVKWKLHADPRLEVALMPSIKVPSAGRAVGNGQWEGGLMLPVVVDLDEEMPAVGLHLDGLVAQDLGDLCFDLSCGGEWLRHRLSFLVSSSVHQSVDGSP